MLDPFDLPGLVPGKQSHIPAELANRNPHCLKGRGLFSRMTPAGTDEQSVEPGTVLFVGAGMEHRFHDIAEELVLLVCFAPPEASTDSEG